MGGWQALSKGVMSRDEWLPRNSASVGAVSSIHYSVYLRGRLPKPVAHYRHFRAKERSE